MSVLTDLNSISDILIFTNSVIDELNMSILDELPQPLLSFTSTQIPPIPPGPIPCFLKGTKILTDNGEKLIETLEKGTNLINHKGEKIKLLDIYSFNTHKMIDTHPCLIKKGTVINGNKCNSDLYLSQAHGVLVKNMFVPIIKLVKPQKIEDNKDYYSYYHLITENFFTDVVVSNGIPSETYSKSIKQRMNRELFNYLLKNITKNDCRILLEKNDFINLIEKFSRIKKMKKIRE